MTGLFSTLLYIVFLLSAILLICVILLQEPKGGGLAEAFGGVGAETFGVRERGINKFTATVAGVFLMSAVGIHLMAGRPGPSAFKEAPPPPGAPAVPGGAGGTPPGNTTPPPGNLPK